MLKKKVKNKTCTCAQYINIYWIQNVPVNADRFCNDQGLFFSCSLHNHRKRLKRHYSCYKIWVFRTSQFSKTVFLCCLNGKKGRKHLEGGKRKKRKENANVFFTWTWKKLHGNAQIEKVFCSDPVFVRTLAGLTDTVYTCTWGMF